MLTQYILCRFYLCWTSICDVDTIHLVLSLHDIDCRYVMLTQYNKRCLSSICVGHNTVSVVLTWCWQSICDADTMIQRCLYMTLTVDMWSWHNTSSVGFTWCWQSICDVDTIYPTLSLHDVDQSICDVDTSASSVVLTWCWQSICDVDTIHVVLPLHDVDRRYVMLTQYI